MTKRSLTRVFILTLLYLYTFLKVLQFLPHEALTAEILSFGIFISMIVGMRFAKWKILGLLTNMMMGFWSIFIVLSIPFDLCLIIYNLVTASSVLHLANQIEISVFGLTCALTFLGLIEALRGPMIKTVKCKIPNLPHDLQDFRIVQLSDLHIGPTIKRKYIENVVNQTNHLAPDVIFITGDIADAKPQTIAADIEPLRGLVAKHGVFYVTGNHEYYWGADDWITAVRNLGLWPLINANRIIQIKQTHLLIAGITDSIGGNFIQNHAPNLSQALYSDEKTEFKILLSHRPSAYIEAEKHGVNLQFSGHTHGGQYFPFNLMVSFFHTYYRHLNRYKNLWLYINTGTGYWGPVNRFGVRAEITLCILSNE